MLDQLRQQIQTYLHELLDEADRLRRALAALGSGDGAASWAGQRVRAGNRLAHAAESARRRRVAYDKAPSAWARQAGWRDLSASRRCGAASVARHL